ncbi:MAG: cyclic nucleotide-binding domain-containing protein, partial [Bdellovibrionales bacterium]|nr:cyclic nucleotide-binding domain-containing protein [Bdellovibrionales bacterium]
PQVLSEADTPDGRIVRLAGNGSSLSQRIVVPHRFQFLWEQLKVGASLYDLCIRQRARGEGSRVFLEVASFLCFLVDHDLIDDVRFVRLADSIRGEYQWPEDILSEFSVSNSVTSWGRKPAHKIAGPARAVDLAMAFVALLSVPMAVATATELFQAGRSGMTSVEILAGFGVSLLVGLFLAGTFGRSGVALLRAMTSRVSGDAGELGWRLDLLGPHFTFLPRTVTGPFRRATDFILCFGISLVPLVLVSIANGLSFTYQVNLAVVLSASFFVMALVTHPATDSELTRSLRVWNRTPLIWREEDELKEVEAFHQIGGLLSVIVASVFVGLFGHFLFQVKDGIESWRRIAVSFGLFGVIFAIVALAYVEPFLRHQIPGSGKRNKRRRLWATRSRVLDVAASDRESWNELPVLRQLTTPLRRQLIAAARVVEYRPGKAVCRQDATDRSLYIILEGKLAVARSYQGRRRKVVAILSAGAAFGETAFFFGVPRTADVIATEECRLLEIPYLPTMRDMDLASNEEFQFRVWLLQALSGNSLLKDLPSEAMDTLIFAGARKKFRAGEVIFTEGAPASACYFIAQGRVSVVKEAKKIRELGSGDAFGEIALLKPGSRRTATVVADSDLLCMELDIEAFWALLAARLPLGAEIERLAIRRLQEDQSRNDN